jgi:drug/metabolite transporter (DMT)-like permease
MLGTITMFVIARTLDVLHSPDRADLPVLFSLGLLQKMGFVTLVTLITLVTVGLQFLPAGQSAILAYTLPIWVVPALSVSLSSAAVLAVGPISSLFILNENPGLADIIKFCLSGMGILIVGFADQQAARIARTTLGLL